MIQIQGIKKKFGKLIALNGISLKIENKGIFGILGPNASGKTTLIKCILGMVIPDVGEIKFEGRNIIGEHTYRKNINYLPQIANFPPNLTVSELIKMVKNICQRDACDRELIEFFELSQFLHKKLGTLSGGTHQKVNLILTFMFDSQLIILDEPTTSLDPISLIKLKKLILKEKEVGKTILLTSHIISFIDEIANDIFFLLEGKIYFREKISCFKKQHKTKTLEQAIANLMLKQHA